MSEFYVRWPSSGGGGGGVTTLNGESGAVNIVAGTGITVSPVGQNITIAATGTSPGGTSGQVQYNNAGAFGGFGNWNGTTLAITGAISTTTTLAVGTNLHVFGTSIMAGDMVVQGGANFSGNLGFYGASEIPQPNGDIFTALTNLGLVTSPSLSAGDIPALAYANQSLSNLTTTSVNQSLIPSSSNTFNIGGSGGTMWLGGYITTLFDSNPTRSIAVEGRALYDGSNNKMFDWAGELNANSHQINNVLDPTSPQDAATKNYVDTHSSTGTVTSVSVVSANGFTGTVATATTTPAITLTGTLTGDVTGTINSNTLSTVNSNVGSFGSSTSIPSFTVNAKGLITAASGSVVIAPAGTLTGTTLNSTVVTSSLTSLGSQSVALNMGTHQINSVVDPTSAQDAATKNYVDSVASGLNPIQAVSAATTGSNISGTYLNGAAGVGATFTTTSTSTFTVDGYTPTLNQRVLFKDQTSGFQNGVYNTTQLATGILPAIFTRSLDYDTASDMNAGDLIPVINGTVNTQTSWLQTATITTVGTDALVFTKWTANPASYLLKANNLSDVANANTSFNNISPMTTGGDLIYGGSSGFATRLPNGSSGQVLISGGGTAAPSWQSVSVNGFQFFSSSQINTISTVVTSAMPTTFSNSPAFTFTPIVTGTYKVYISVPTNNNNSTTIGYVNIIETTAIATLLQDSRATIYNLNNIISNQYIQAVYILTSGSTYTFDIQGSSSSAPGAVSLYASASAPCYMFAELCG